MQTEMIIGLLFFVVFILSLLQFLIRKHCEKVKLRRSKAQEEFICRRAEVERKARRQL